jgi:hypothetical protein
MGIQAAPADQAVPEETEESVKGASKRGIDPLGSATTPTTHTSEFQGISQPKVSIDQTGLTLIH